MVWRYRLSRCLAICDRKVFAFAFDLKPLRAFGRFEEGSKSEMYAWISSVDGCCGSIFGHFSLDFSSKDSWINGRSRLARRRYCSYRATTRSTLGPPSKRHSWVAALTSRSNKQTCRLPYWQCTTAIHVLHRPGQFHIRNAKLARWRVTPHVARLYSPNRLR